MRTQRQKLNKSKKVKNLIDNLQLNYNNDLNFYYKHNVKLSELYSIVTNNLFIK